MHLGVWKALAPPWIPSIWVKSQKLTLSHGLEQVTKTFAEIAAETPPMDRVLERQQWQGSNDREFPPMFNKFDWRFVQGSSWRRTQSI